MTTEPSVVRAAFLVALQGVLTGETVLDEPPGKEASQYARFVALGDCEIGLDADNDSLIYYQDVLVLARHEQLETGGWTAGDSRTKLGSLLLAVIEALDDSGVRDGAYWGGLVIEGRTNTMPVSIGGIPFRYALLTVKIAPR